ncbi:fimbrial protein [Burkholderia metallica]|uniref:fimbrial protein n=1 Tax=Burkholderia metallica TaxID=488729 RepID=UPI00157AA6DA|nr:fimbrial protein [Burkholderia metallica]
MTRKIIVNISCASIILLGMVSPVMAARCWGGASFGTVQANFPGRTVNPQPGLPVGSVLDTISVNIPSRRSNTVVCDSRSVQLNVEIKGRFTPVGNNVYQTGVPGIGVRIHTNADIPYDSYNTNSRGNSYYENLETPSTNTLPQYYPPFKWFVYGGTFTLEIIKTGEISPGKVFSGTIGEVSGGGITWRRFSFSGDVVVQPTSCKVTSQSIQVPLGSVPQRSFKGVGSTTPPVNFSIPIDCSGVAKNVYMTFTDSSNVGNTGNILPLTKNSTAKGIGIQILPGDGAGDSYPIAFGPGTGGINQQLVASLGKSAEIGKINVKLRARYVQTAEKVVPGTANGVVTYTISYQ